MLVHVGREVLTALETTGITSPPTSHSPTWLDVLHQSQQAIEEARDHLDRAQQLRAQLDVEALPSPLRAELAAIDRVLEQSAKLTTLLDELPTFEWALVFDGPIRYLFLFQHPAKLRPAGGFPGTVALVTVERGQLRDYVFYEVHQIANTYVAHRPRPVPDCNLPSQGELLLHDANW